MDIRKLNLEKILKRWSQTHAKEEEYLTRNIWKHIHLKARIHGFICGDGYISKRIERQNGKIHCEIRFYPDHRSLILPFLTAFEKVYGKRPSVRKLVNYYKLSLTSKVVVTNLMEDGPLDTHNWSVPDWVTSDPQNSREWLRAFFDAEAYVGQREIRIQCVNKQGLLQVQDMLGKFGIGCKEYSYQRKNNKWNTNYHLAIFKKSDRARFFRTIGFNHIIKLQKLRKSIVDAKVA